MKVPSSLVVISIYLGPRHSVDVWSTSPSEPQLDPTMAAIEPDRLIPNNRPEGPEPNTLDLAPKSHLVLLSPLDGLKVPSTNLKTLWTGEAWIPSRRGSHQIS